MTYVLGFISVKAGSAPDELPQFCPKLFTDVGCLSELFYGVASLVLRLVSLEVPAISNSYLGNIHG
jgi:hypothetical protein